MATSVYTSLLAKDYKRKLGEIKALRKELREIAKVTLERERELNAIKAIILAREPDYDFDRVKSIATYPKVLGLKWNLLTTLILRCLREANGTVVQSNHITEYVIEMSGLEVPNRQVLVIVQTSVKHRLKALAKSGKVIRHHELKSTRYGTWSLPCGE